MNIVFDMPHLSVVVARRVVDATQRNGKWDQGLNE